MATLLDAYTMANDATFINRVSQALAVQCDTVRQEEGVPNHDRRRALMLLVISDVNAYAYRFARQVVGNAAVASKAPDGTAVPDGDIVFVVSELWNAFTDLYVPAADAEPASGAP